MNPELDGFIAAAKSIAADSQTLFGGLNEAQLNWQPGAGRWSVGLCLEHLIKTNGEMCGAIEKHVRESNRKTIFERLALGADYFGKRIVRATRPETKAKTKAPKIFRPARSNVGADVVERFVENQREVIELMQRSDKLDLQRTIVTSPVAPFIVYSLWNAYKIIVSHERRHFRQAQNVMRLDGFPE